jgi:hypothetical protein
VGASTALSQTEACDELAKLKQASGRDVVHGDDELLEKYRVLLSECSGLDPSAHEKLVDAALKADTTLATDLTAEQVQAWRELTIASRGLAIVQWDRARRAPAWIELGMRLSGTDAAAARADFDARAATLVVRLFGIGPTDAFDLVEEKAFENREFESLTATRVARYVHQRRSSDLPVFGNVLDLTLRSDEHAGIWQGFVAAHWARDAGASAGAPAVTAADAVDAALASGEVPHGSANTEPELGICDFGASIPLCYQLRLSNDAGQSWTYMVSATDGAILRKADNVKHYNGSLQVYVGRPHEESNKYARPLPRASIYEDPATYSEAPGCGYSTVSNRTRGDTSRVLGSTTYSGTYTNLTGIDPADTSWDVDDTVLTILDRLNGSVLASNDDCPGTGSLRSCIFFTPSATKYYVVRAYPYSSNSTGAGKTYRFKLQMQQDDIGDDRNEAAPLVANNGYVTRTLNSSTDSDVFRLSAGGSETMSFHACSDAGASVKVEVLNAAGSVVASTTTTGCASNAANASVTRGTWFLRVTSPTGATGAYKVRALLVTDIDTGGSAWVLTGDHTGRVIGSRFESGSDEDWFSYNAPVAGRYLIVETFGPGVAADLEVYAPSTTVYGRQGTLDSLPDTSGKGYGHWMIRNDGGGLDSGAARIAFMAPVAGTYRIRVRSRDQVASSYYLMFEDTGINGGWHAMP